MCPIFFLRSTYKWLKYLSIGAMEDEKTHSLDQTTPPPTDVRRPTSPPNERPTFPSQGISQVARRWRRGGLLNYGRYFPAEALAETGSGDTEPWT
jgi:hypothetical protein